MSDRELLEKAAKAAGIDLQWIGEGRMAACFDPESVSEWWNPLTDDGDALRLAVKLDIQITPGSADSPYAVCSWWVRPSLTTMEFERELVEGDRNAALRRCIVRAAAALAGDTCGEAVQ